MDEYFYEWFFGGLDSTQPHDYAAISNSRRGGRRLPPAPSPVRPSLSFTFPRAALHFEIGIYEGMV